MRGRPKKYTKQRIKEILINLEIYIANTCIPIIAEFAYQNEIPRQYLYEIKELSDTIKRLIDKKEANLERLALDNKINHVMAIFSLKQLGWKDKSEVDHNVKVEKTILEVIADQLIKNNEVQKINE